MIAAVAIPYIDVRKDDRLRQKAPDREATWITHTYIGTTHAVRRDVFLEAGGYCEDFVRQGEESDLCLRMLERGYVVRLGNADPIHHFESPRRDFQRMDFYGLRNDVLFVWQNVPWTVLIPHLAMTTVNGLRWGAKTGRLAGMVRGLIWGLLCLSEILGGPQTRPNAGLSPLPPTQDHRADSIGHGSPTASVINSAIHLVLGANQRFFDAKPSNPHGLVCRPCYSRRRPDCSSLPCASPSRLVGCHGCGHRLRSNRSE